MIDFSSRISHTPAAWFVLAVLVAAADAAPATIAAADEAPSPAPAVAPTLVHYQGRFGTPGGVPLPGPVTLQFRLFPGASGGSPLWTEEHAAVPLDEGVASVLLGSINALPVSAFSATQRYLEIAVDGETLAPRMVVASAPFALEAARLDGKTAADFEVAGAAQAATSALAQGDGTPPNEGSNRLHWENLTGVPEGLADGIDDAGGATTHGELEGLEDDDHPQYLLRGDAATGDGSAPNTGANRVHWENLVGVPEDFVDGTDNVFTGSGSELTGADIRDSTLTAVDIQPESLTGGTLAPRTITGDRLALETIDGDQILDDGVRSADILDNTVASIDIKDGTVATVDLADGAVTSAKIANGTIQAADLAFVPGDITSVIAGSGLAGGAQSGDVTLSVGQGSGISVQGATVSLAPSYISGSAYDGRFVARSSPNWTPVTGAVSVTGASFRPVTPTGKFTVIAGDGYLFVDNVNNAGAEDEFTAPIQLPHGAEVTQFWASVWDNSSASLEINLWRGRQNGATRTKVASVTTSDQIAAWRSLDDSIITETLVDNIEYTYWLEADFPSTPAGADLRLLSVRVVYTVNKPY